MTGKDLDRLVLLVLLLFVCAGAWRFRLRRDAETRAAYAQARQAYDRADSAAARAAAIAGSDTQQAGGGGDAGAPVANWPEVVAGGQVLGDANARVRMVEFGDYLCSHCAKTASAVRALIQAHPGEVAVVYRNYPIFGERSYSVAMAAECAASQGRFAEAHDAIYGGVLWRADGMNALVSAAAIPDAATFHACLDRQLPRGRIDMDRAAGDASGVGGTPAFVVNGRLYVGEQTLEELEALLQDALAHPR